MDVLARARTRLTASARSSSTRRIACRSGGTTFDPSIGNCRCCDGSSRTCRCSLSPPPRLSRVRSDIMQQLALRDAAVHVASFNRPNLYYAVRRRKTSSTYAELLARARRGDAGIVYCLSRKRVDELSELLQADGIAALPYHAGLDADVRRRNQEAFIRDEPRSWSRRSRSAWESTSPTCAGSSTTICRAPWKATTRNPAVPDATVIRPSACCISVAGDIRTAEFLIQQKVDPGHRRAARGRAAHRAAATAPGPELRRIERVPTRDSVALLRRGVFRTVRRLRQLPRSRAS